MSPSPKRLPETLTMWRDSALEWKATGGMDALGSPVKVSSASKFDFINFLGLQVLYDFPNEKSRLPHAITKQFPSSPGNLLESLPGYETYLDEIEKAGEQMLSPELIAKICVPRNLSAFVNVWQFQRHILVGDEHAADVPKILKITPVSPVANRTRARIRAREHPTTPTPRPKFNKSSLVGQMASLTLGDSDIVSSMGLGTDTLDYSLVGHRAISLDDDDEKNPGMHFPTLSSSYQNRPCVIRHILGAVVPNVGHNVR